MFEVKKVKISEIILNKNNPRVIADEKFKKLVRSIKEFPEMLEVRPIVVDDDMVVLGGNMRTKACIKAGLKEVPVIKFSDLSEEKKKEFIVKDNVGYGDWDFDVLRSDWDKEILFEWGLEVPDIKYKDSLVDYGGKLSDRFIAPPFSILDAKQGYWQDRKKVWRELIGDNGESRENTLVKDTNSAMGDLGSVSLLDPVLSEIITKWFSPFGAKIFDPFAGDTVFGYVSTYQNDNSFTGIEIRKEQADLNMERTNERCVYICDDGRNVSKYIEEKTQDLLFSCPPYYDLEVYSDLENDASNQETYEDFFKILDVAFTNAVKCLKDNRFAVIVVGEVRDKKTGFYYDFISDIKKLFIREGMGLYNEIILCDPIGSSMLRANKLMKLRKVVKTHQNILVFYKGDIERIKEDFPSLDYSKEKMNELYGSTDV
jgi:hypothetical protein